MHRLMLLLVISAAACGSGSGSDSDPVVVTLDDGELTATCNWNGECSPDLRYFEHESGGVRLWFVFDVAIAQATDLAAIRAALDVGEAELDDSLLPPHEPYVPCGYQAPTPELISYAGGRLAGTIDGAIRLCREVGGDGLDPEGVDPVPFLVSFDLGFDPATVAEEQHSVYSLGERAQWRALDFAATERVDPLPMKPRAR